MSDDSDSSDGKGMAGGSARDRFAKAVERIGPAEAEGRIREFVELPVEIPWAVVEKVQAALNVALSLALLHAKPMHQQIMEAALALDDALEAAEPLDD